MSLRERTDEIRAAFSELDAIALEDIIGPGEVLALAGGVTRATLKNWREGRGVGAGGAFPDPIKHVSGVDLFDRHAVAMWLERRR